MKVPIQVSEISSYNPQNFRIGMGKLIPVDQPRPKIKMALTYVVCLLLVLQITVAAPTDTTTEDISTEFTTIVNETLEIDNNSTETVTILPLLNNTTYDNETVVEPIVNTDVSGNTSATGEIVVETIGYSPEPETTTASPPVTKETSNIKNLAFLVQPGMLAVFLPICVRLLTSWNRCL
ncbi:hypothetical protein NPIL_289181 [Nephila pilipes]|uniref:Uncharacterized protein n=1 Tax=Nephila pilipes TaxID=299642 RepID=A0A8X6NTY0_NEPPI|nr:hypothetical protein NPIL_289181 [Nephila pilipes]